MLVTPLDPFVLRLTASFSSSNSAFFYFFSLVKWVLCHTCCVTGRSSCARENFCYIVVFVLVHVLPKYAPFLLRHSTERALSNNAMPLISFMARGHACKYSSSWFSYTACAELSSAIEAR
ncbi:hypothetical protein LZ32DRAFT_329152 [Colletotrichum eremochloae]|nr:hypothetical protein LZ32DRAFT_329152 [Colletotrichum eremochloae]